MKQLLVFNQRYLSLFMLNILFVFIVSSCQKDIEISDESPKDNLDKMVDEMYNDNLFHPIILNRKWIA